MAKIENDSNETPGSNFGEPLETSRLMLRQFVESDKDQIQILLNDRELASHTSSIDFPIPEYEGQKLITRFHSLWQKGEAYVFAIQLRDDPLGQAIGGMGLEIDQKDHRAELGYWFGREYWNQGYCTEAVGRMLEFGFETLGLNKITAHHVARNPASGRVLVKSGFHEEGQFRKHIRKWGVFEDVVVYGLLAADRAEA